MVRRLVIAGFLASALAGCGLMTVSPRTTPIAFPPECRMFTHETEIVWTGHGHPADVGLMAADPTYPSGDIFVERDPVDGGDAGIQGRHFCVVNPSSTTTMYGFPVPDGWTPPETGGE